MVSNGLDTNKINNAAVADHKSLNGHRSHHGELTVGNLHFPRQWKRTRSVNGDYAGVLVAGLLQSADLGEWSFWINALHG
jgi:hypothetical protein